MNKAVSLVVLAACLAACQAAPLAATGSPEPVWSATSTSAVETAEISAPTILPTCADGQHCAVDPGSYITGAEGFFPGLAITIPPEAYFGEQDSGELALFLNGYPDDGLRLWKDVRVVYPTRPQGSANVIVATVAATPAAYVEWFTSNQAFTVVEQSKPAALAGTTGMVFGVEASESAAYGDPECPPNPRCADLVTDPAHWGSGYFVTGGTTVVRLYIASVHYADADHLFVIEWDSPSPAALQEGVARTQSVIDSIRLPTTYIAN